MAQILFVDDDIYALEMLTRAVEMLGHQAFTARNISDALHIISNSRPALIFTDLHLPGEHGTSLIAKLQSQPDLADIPVYVLSASPAEEADERSRAAGAVAFLDKPLKISALAEIIASHGL